MDVSVGKLYDSVKECGIKLLAGKDGLNRRAKWVHMVENEEICGFLKGEEIILITGVALKSDDELISLVKSVIQYGASGIIINLGPYIKSIPLKVLEFCEERQVAVFSVPWNVYMAEIMRKFCLMITLEAKKEIELSTAIKNAILYPNQKELYVNYLENYGLVLNEQYIVLLINIQNDKKEEGNINGKMLVRQIENYLYNNQWECIVVEIDEEIFLLFKGNYNDVQVEEYFKELIENCTSLKNNDHVYCGIGECVDNISKINKSYQQAKSVINLQRKHVELRESLKYRDLGIYKLLLEIKDREIIKSYVDETIGTVLKYDEINNSNLLEVLKIYLKNNRSIKETANKLFIHRNTVNYKIGKVNKILNINLADNEASTRVLVALKLYDILEI